MPLIPPLSSGVGCVVIVVHISSGVQYLTCCWEEHRVVTHHYMFICCSGTNWYGLRGCISLFTWASSFTLLVMSLFSSTQDPPPQIENFERMPNKNSSLELLLEKKKCWKCIRVLFRPERLSRRCRFNKLFYFLKRSSIRSPQGYNIFSTIFV